MIKGKTELKYINSNGEIVVASNLNNINFFFGKYLKIEFINKHYMLFFLKDVMIAQKTKSFILFTTIINTKLINTFHVYMDLFYKEKIMIKILEVFWYTCSYMDNPNKLLRAAKKISKIQWKNNYTPTKLIHSCTSKNNFKNHNENWHWRNFSPLGINFTFYSCLEKWFQWLP